MSDKKFKRFGKYLILDHLFDGGMAKICRARHLGEQANKLVAVKMVQPQFSNDEAFVRMFQDELNITFGMLHPNIMQVYDYGKVDGQLYTAMEYIHGANLKQYLDRLKEKKVVFPVEISCFIISQVCLGLHYAHTFTDKLTGKPFNIVHRDISPHNIMLTYDGAVKVIDFGIAKATTNSESTQAGTIKGKLSYLAPEYLDGLELDARYDEFAVGITLWEMLCSRKLFQANNDLAVLKQIQSCKIIAPSEINPSVPKELDAIVMKALSKDRTHRYENLDQMNRALVRFLYSTYPDFNASDLKTFADDLFKAEIEKDRVCFVDYGSIDIQPYIEDMKQDENRPGRLNKKDINSSGRPTASNNTPNEKQRILELDIEPVKVDVGLGGQAAHGINSTRKLNKAALQKAKVNSKNSRLNLPSSRSKGQDKTKGRTLNKKELAATAEASESSSFPTIIFIFAASFAGLSYFQAPLIEDLTGFNLYKLIHGAPKQTRTISSEPKERSKKAKLPLVKEEESGKLILGGVDISMEVYVNGNKTEYIGKPVQVPLNEQITVAIKKPGHVPYITKLILDGENNSSVVNVPKLEKARMGLLTTSQNYAAGSKLVYEEAGELIERNLPFKDIQIPEGSYQAKVINPILGTEKKVEFVIEENKKHFLE